MAETTAKKITMSETVFGELIKLRDELESILETIERMNDKELLEGLERSKKDVENGKIYELENVDDFDDLWK